MDSRPRSGATPGAGRLERTPLMRVGVVLLSTSIALGAARLLAPVFNDAPVPLFLGAVMISAWYGGMWPGVLTTVLSGLALDRFFDLSRGASLLSSEDTAFDLALFVAVALLSSALNARLRALARRVAAARAQAEAAVLAREELLAVVAHDLKSPLTGIKMGAEVAVRRLERSEAPVDERVRTILDEMATSAQHMAGVLDDLLDAAQLEAGQLLRLYREPTRLLDLVETAARAHQRVSPRHEIRVVATADPVGDWDPRRLARVLDNLLSNAIKYSPAGGEVTVEVSEPDATHAAVSVRDQGLGIPAADLDRLFENFFRASNVSHIAGTGIGLAGARRIVDLHGGTLTVQSQEGHGSTFTVRLPRTSAGEPQSNGPGQRSEETRTEVGGSDDMPRDKVEKTQVFPSSWQTSS
jgi:signal transduction histidine kinase